MLSQLSRWLVRCHGNSAFAVKLSARWFWWMKHLHRLWLLQDWESEPFTRTRVSTWKSLESALMKDRVKVTNVLKSLCRKWGVHLAIAWILGTVSLSLSYLRELYPVKWSEKSTRAFITVYWLPIKGGWNLITKRPIDLISHSLGFQSKQPEGAENCGRWFGQTFRAISLCKIQGLFLL